MNHHIKNKISCVALAVGMGLLTGCAALSTDGTRVSKATAQGPAAPQPSPVFRAQNHYQWVKRLKIAKPVESLEGRMPTPATSTMLPIPLPPTALQQYGLVIDQHQQLAWLKGPESYGPFPLSNPDVTHLVKSIQESWQEQAAWQAMAAQQASLMAPPQGASPMTQQQGQQPFGESSASASVDFESSPNSESEYHSEFGSPSASE